MCYKDKELLRGSLGNIVRTRGYLSEDPALLKDWGSYTVKRLGILQCWKK